MDWQSLGRVMVGIGALLFIAGLIMMGLGKFFNFGSLPGDIVYEKGNFTFYFPIVTCIILSVIFSLILKLFFRK
ncbi:MAG: DUF2905 domain-containing protein [Dehalobacterium sp.]